MPVSASRRPRLVAKLFGSALLAATLGCAGKGPGASQEPAPAKFAFKPLPCDSLPAPPDSVDETVYMGIQAPVHGRPLPPGFADAVLDGVRQAFQPPRPMALPVFVASDTAGPMPVPPSRSTVLRPALAAEVQFTLGDTGAVVGRLSTSSLSGALDSALVRAPARADSLHLLPQSFGPGGLGEPVKFFVSLLTSQPPVPPWAPLFMLRVPQWRGAHGAQPVSADATASPEATAIHGKVHQEWVVYQVVVDESGHAMPSTIRLVQAHYREFARAAVGRLETTTYRAASIGGCAVKGIAELRYSFAVAQ
jgi:hypothetical protein